MASFPAARWSARCMHGRFSLETGKGVNSASASSCVKSFRTQVEDGVVFLEVANEGVQSEEASPQKLREMCIQSSASALVTDFPLGG